MQNLPDSVQRIQLDVTNEDSLQAAVDTVLTTAGRIDILGELLKPGRTLVGAESRA